MKILVQRTDTSEYYIGPGVWTHFAHQALQWESARLAEEFCRASLRDVPRLQLVIQNISQPQRPTAFVPIRHHAQ